MTAFTRHIGWLAAIAAVCSMTVPARAEERLVCTPANTADADRMLRAKIRSEKLYLSWTKEQCLSLYAEHCDSTKVDIAVKERHSAACGGDPDTSPTVDRFRIYRKSGKIERYNVVEANFDAQPTKR